MDLAAAQARVKGDRKRDLVGRLELAEQLRGLVGQRDAVAPLALVGPEVDVGQRVAVDVAPRAVLGPCVDRAGDCLDVRHARVGQSVARELVEELLPLALADLIRRSVPELRVDRVGEIGRVGPDRRRRVGRRLAAPPALDPARPHALDPGVAERLEGAPALRLLSDGLGCLLTGADPRRGLRGVLRGLAPHGLVGQRIAATATVGRTALARLADVEGGRASLLVLDVDALGFRLAVLRIPGRCHVSLACERRAVRAKPIPLWTHCGHKHPGSSPLLRFVAVEGHPTDTSEIWLYNEENPAVAGFSGDAGGGTRTPDTRIMIPLL